MNLLNYTKKLSEKISYYDSFTKKAKIFSMSNPFKIPENMTVVWVENTVDKRQNGA